MDLLLIIPPLFAGAVIGYFEPWPEFLRRIDGVFSHIVLLLLLVLMGTKIGSEKAIVQNIGDIGLRSLIIAGASILGSVAFVKLISPLLKFFSETAGEVRGGSPKLDFQLTLSIIVALVIGLFLGYTLVPGEITGTIDSIVTYVLGLLLLAVGISLGLNKRIYRQVSTMGMTIILLPLGIAAGSILGPLAISFFLRLTPFETAAVGAGFGWYSLSAILLTELHGPELGATAFLTNIFRETLTFVFLPFSAKFLGKIVSIAPGGATTMDVTLPLLKEIWGEEVILPAFFSGAVLSSLVPFVVPLLIGI